MLGIREPILSLRRCCMELYTGFDLHSNNSYVGIIDEGGRRLWKKKLRNDPSLILETLQPFKKDIKVIVVESSYDCYWLVDCLMEKGYRLHLANPYKIEQYSGLKHADDEHDAFWFAEILRLNILPEGFIYPKEQRPLGTL
jgi:transposase